VRFQGVLVNPLYKGYIYICNLCNEYVLLKYSTNIVNVLSKKRKYYVKDVNPISVFWGRLCLVQAHRQSPTMRIERVDSMRVRGVS